MPAQPAARRGAGDGLRITHVLATDAFAGTERYVVDVASRQAELGAAVAVVGGDPVAMRRHLAGSSVHHVAGSTGRGVLRALLRGGRRDVLHSHIARADFTAAAAAPVLGAAHISTRHITAPRGWGRAARALAPVVRRRLALEVAVSAWTSAQLEQPSDVVLVNGVSPTWPPTAPRRRTVLVAQRLEPEKDTLTALRAWAFSGLGDRGWELHLAGEGAQRPALEAEAAALGIGGTTHFCGWLDDMPGALAQAGLLLATAPAEPCGLSVLEAMASGLPVVATGAAGHLETVGTVAGAALFPPGDAETAAASLVALAGDDDARSRYGERLRAAQQERFTVQGHVDALADLYRSALSGQRSHRLRTAGGDTSLSAGRSARPGARPAPRR